MLPLKFILLNRAQMLDMHLNFHLFNANGHLSSLCSLSKTHHFGYIPHSFWMYMSMIEPLSFFPTNPLNDMSTYLFPLPYRFTPHKSNIDAKNDGLDHVSPASNMANVGYLCQISRGTQRHFSNKNECSPDCKSYLPASKSLGLWAIRPPEAEQPGMQQMCGHVAHKNSRVFPPIIPQKICLVVSTKLKHMLVKLDHSPIWR